MRLWHPCENECVLYTPLLSLTAPHECTLIKFRILLSSISTAPHGHMRGEVCIELTRRGRRHEDGSASGWFNRSMYGTRDAPQVGQDVVEETMGAVGFNIRVLQFSGCHARKGDSWYCFMWMTYFVHVVHLSQGQIRLDKDHALC